MRTTRLTRLEPLDADEPADEAVLADAPDEADTTEPPEDLVLRTFFRTTRRVRVLRAADGEAAASSVGVATAAVRAGGDTVSTTSVVDFCIGLATGAAVVAADRAGFRV